MPNWCFTEIQISSNDELTDLKPLYDKIKTTIRSKPLVTSDWGSRWLGNLLTAFDINWETISCRGQIIDCSFDETTPAINISTETAWEPTPAIATVDAILKHEKLDAKILWYGDEPGVELYLTNDPSYNICQGKYHLIFRYGDLDIEEGYMELDDALAAATKYASNLKNANDFSSTKFVSEEQLERFSDEAYETDENSEICLHIFDYVSVFDYVRSNNPYYTDN